jgi:dipeptidyl-peptidase-4
MKFSILTLIILTSLGSTVFAQDEISGDDYNRAVGFLYDNYNNKKVFNLYIQPNWFPDSTGMWFVHHSPDNKKYLKIAFPDLIQQDLFNHQKLSEILSDSLSRDISANDLPISHLEYKNPAELEITVDAKTYILNTATYALKPSQEDEEINENEKQSPDNRWIAYTKDYNLYIKSTQSEEIKQLSSKGDKGYEYATWYGWGDIMEGENGARPDHFGVDWSENSEWISTNIYDFRSAQKMHLLDWSVDTLYRPKLLSYYRGSPGDTSMIYVEPVFFNTISGKEIKVGLPRSTHINAIGVQWSKKPGKVFLYRTSRGYQNIYIYAFDLKAELLDTLYSETSKTNIDNFTYEFAEKSNFMFFLSEKSGWRQLYSLDLHTKKEKSLTNGAFYINNIEHIDEENQKIFFTASGREEVRNPYYQHLYSISFNGKNLRLLTPEHRHHQISISPDGKYMIDNFSTVNIPTRTVLRKTTSGEILMEIGNADISQLEHWTPPEIFTAKARDNKTTIYGAIWKPTNFDSTSCYPVIEMSYTGPHTQVFPKDFSRAFSLQSFAELGFIGIVVDGLGSSGRSKEFHNHSYKNLGGNLEDHVIAIKQLGQKYSWIDTSRVGIFGHSAGGYDAAHAVLKYPEFYQVAVASSADHDHRMEKAWWPEMYMGWPVDSAYHLQSNITMAGNLKGKLLITHGGIFNPVHALEIVMKAQSAKKEALMIKRLSTAMVI